MFNVLCVANLDAHDHMIALGARHTHYDADWEDTGDAESGPMLRGGPAYDEYEFDEFRVYIDHEGHVSDQIARDFAQEAWEEGMAETDEVGDGQE